MKLPYPTILVPGITATYLKDLYPLPPEYIWKVMSGSKAFERVTLHPDNLKYEAKEPAVVRPDQVYEISYRELIKELREELTENEEEPVPVYAFGYDWRQPLSEIEKSLDKFIEEVISRTLIMRHYRKDGYAKERKVNLIGHSMGGLIITGYLDSKGNSAPVHKVATLATPYKGSFEPIVKITMGTGNLGTSEPSHRERKAARVTPSLYHLLPRFEKGVNIHSSLPQTLFDTSVWQPSVLKSISDYVHNNSSVKRTRPNSEKQALKLFEALLNDAEQYGERIKNFSLDKVGIQPKQWLAIVGAGSKTRVQTSIVKNEQTGDIRFYFDSDEDLQNGWDKKNVSSQKRRQTGDGTVPLEGAIPDFIPENRLVLITPDDFEFWELQDLTLTKIGGFHGILPNMNMVQRLLTRYLQDKEDIYNNTWGRAVPGSEENWEAGTLFGLKQKQ